MSSSASRRWMSAQSQQCKDTLKTELTTYAVHRDDLRLGTALHSFFSSYPNLPRSDQMHMKFGITEFVVDYLVGEDFGLDQNAIAMSRYSHKYEEAQKIIGEYLEKLVTEASLTPDLIQAVAAGIDQYGFYWDQEDYHRYSAPYHLTNVLGRLTVFSPYVTCRPALMHLGSGVMAYVFNEDSYLPNVTPYLEAMKLSWLIEPGHIQEFFNFSWDPRNLVRLYSTNPHVYTQFRSSPDVWSKVGDQQEWDALFEAPKGLGGAILGRPDFCFGTQSLNVVYDQRSGELFVNYNKLKGMPIGTQNMPPYDPSLVTKLSDDKLSLLAGLLHHVEEAISGKRGGMTTDHSRWVQHMKDHLREYLILYELPAIATELQNRGIAAIVVPDPGTIQNHRQILRAAIQSVQSPSGNQNGGAGASATPAP